MAGPLRRPDVDADIGNLLDNNAMQLGDMVAEFSSGFEGLLTATIVAATPENDRRAMVAGSRS
jgi:hypothetical protein